MHIPMNNRIFAVFTLLLLTVITPLASAAKVVGLYEAQLSVANLEVKARQALVPQGLRRVVIKVSGNSAAANKPAILDALKQAGRYIKEFSYGEALPDGRLPLKLSFNKSAVDGLLRNAGLPYWPQNRPSLLVWMVEDSFDQGQSDRQLVSPEENPDLAQALAMATEIRGLAVETPLLDLDDRLALPANAAWRLDEGLLLQASRRYNDKLVALVRMSKTGTGEWRSAWLLINKGERQIFDARGPERELMLAAGFEQVANYLGNQYAVVSKHDDAPPVLLQLSGVTNFKAYSHVLRYLSRLAIVRHAEPGYYSSQGMSLRIFFDGELAQLKEAIALESVLIAEPGLDDLALNPQLHYRYLDTDPVPDEAALLGETAAPKLILSTDG